MITIKRTQYIVYISEKDGENTIMTNILFESVEKAKLSASTGNKLIKEGKSFSEIAFALNGNNDNFKVFSPVAKPTLSIPIEVLK